MDKLNEQVAIVTGAANGIGFGIAQKLAMLGARVMLADLAEDAGQAAVQRLTSSGLEASFTKTDISDPAAIARLVTATTARYGEVDILVNNAGIVSEGPVTGIDLAHWQKLMAIDLTAVFLLTKAVLPSMAERGHGRIINIASVAGQQGGGMLGNSCYAAAKGGVIAFTKGIAREGGPHGITANAICPALTETHMTEKLPDDMRAQVLAAMPLGRPGTPLDIANAVAFLASESAAFITGVTLNVDGGFMRY